MDETAKEITQLLYDAGMIRTWLKDNPKGWKLHSGKWSPFYIQLRMISSNSNSQEILQKVGAAMGNMIKEKAHETTKIVGVALAGIPMAIAITMCSGIPSCYTRSFPDVKDVSDLEQKAKDRGKKYGEFAFAEGEFSDGDNLVLVDDLVTDFQSKVIAKTLVDSEAKRRGIKVTCQNVAVLFDREQGASGKARELKMNLLSLIPFRSQGLEWLRERMTEKEHDVIGDYLGNPDKFQNEKIQRKLEQYAKEFKSSKK